MNKKLIYIANIRLPTEKAHGLQIMKMCEAFASSGITVKLVIPTRKNHITDDPFSYYEIKNNFTIKKLPCIDTIGLGKLGFYFQRLVFVIVMSFFVFDKNDWIFYTRGEFTALVLKILGKKNVIWEAHRGSNNLVVRTLSKRNIKMVTISEALKMVYVSFGFDEKRILVAPDAVDLTEFDIDISREGARIRANLPLDKQIVLYTGHLYDWKGADLLAEAAKFLDSNDLVVFVGGTESDLERFRGKFANTKGVLILGQKPHKDIPIYQKSADLLVLPNSAKEEISRLYTSPMKLFEYMASGIPIIASNLPSIREILDDSRAYFFEPDKPVRLAESIKYALDHEEESAHKAKLALEAAQQYSWDNRARLILRSL